MGIPGLLATTNCLVAYLIGRILGLHHPADLEFRLCSLEPAWNCHIRCPNAKGLHSKCTMCMHESGHIADARAAKRRKTTPDAQPENGTVRAATAAIGDAAACSRHLRDGGGEEGSERWIPHPGGGPQPFVQTKAPGQAAIRSLVSSPKRRKQSAPQRGAK